MKATEDNIFIVKEDNNDPETEIILSNGISKSDLFSPRKNDDPLIS